jgi:hypothetical protein
MIVQQIVFFIFTCALLGTLLWMLHQTKQGKVAVIFSLSLFSLLAFYLLYFGSLDSFTVKGLSTEATFVQRKTQQVVKDAAIIEDLKKEFQLLVTESRSKQDALDSRLIALSVAMDATERSWTTNITLSPNQTATMSRAWGQLAKITLNGPAALTADLSTWPSNGVIMMDTEIWAGTNQLNIITNYLTDLRQSKTLTGQLSFIWQHSEGKPTFEGR